MCQSFSIISKCSQNRIYLFYGLFTDAVSIRNYTTFNGKTISEQRTGKYMGGSGRHAILQPAWRNWGKPRKSSGSIARCSGRDLNRETGKASLLDPTCSGLLPIRDTPLSHTPQGGEVKQKAANGRSNLCQELWRGLHSISARCTGRVFPPTNKVRGTGMTIPRPMETSQGRTGSHLVLTCELCVLLVCKNMWLLFGPEGVHWTRAWQFNIATCISDYRGGLDW
jgi:hypothetical protein